MKSRWVQGKALTKFSDLVQPHQDWLNTLEFYFFLESVQHSETMYEVFWDENYCFFLEEEKAGHRHAHGCFRYWTDIDIFLNTLKGEIHLAFGMEPQIRTSVKVAHTGLILHYKMKTDIPVHAPEDVSPEEVISFIASKSPHLLNEWFIKDILESLKLKTYHLKRNSSGRIEFIHLLKPQENYFRGVYFASDLAFSETIREFYKGHVLCGDREIRAVVMEDNEVALNLHKMLGYEDTGRKNYYLTLRNN